MAADGNEAQVTGEETATVRPLVAAALLPLDGEPSGPNLEYDADMLELVSLAAGKPETQFAPAQPPVWHEVLERAQALLPRSRDLRTALIWLRAVLNTEGLAGLPDALTLITGWLDTLWDSVHPQLDPDDHDPSARLSVLGTLIETGGALGDLRAARLSDDRRLGNLRVRDFEVVLGRLPARPGDEKHSTAELDALFGDHPDLGAQVRGASLRAQTLIERLQRQLDDRVGTERAVALAPLRNAVRAVVEVLGDAPEAAPAEETAVVAAADGAAAPETARAAPTGRRSGVFSIDSRQDAVRALELICDYLDRSEPTNPAQLFLRRASKLIDMNFLELVRELAPEGLRDAARVMGVDPDGVGEGN